MNRIFFLFLSAVFSLHAITLTKEYTYAASENDSKASAKAQALKILKNLTIEELGSGMATRFSSDEKIQNDAIEKELHSSVKSFTAAFLQTKILDESWDGTNYRIKVQIDVDDAGLYTKTLLHFKALQAQALGKELEKMLEDISTKEKRDAFIEKAITLEFGETLGFTLHRKTLRVFSYHKIYDERYRNFLLKTLETITYPSWDERTDAILSYLQNDRPYDAKEREILLKILENTEVAQSGHFLLMMLQPNAQACEAGVTELLEAYLALVLEKKAALPVYTDLKTEFNSVLEGWAQSQNKECPFLGSDALLKVLQSEQASSLEATTWIKAFQKCSDATAKNNAHAKEKLLPLIRAIAPNLPPKREAKEAIITLYKKAQKTLHAELTNVLREPIRRIFAAEKLYESDIEFCIANGITVAQKVFTLQEYYEKLFAESAPHKRREWVKAISYFAEANGGENHATYLRALTFLDTQNDHYHAEIMLGVMEKIGYDDRESITLLGKFIASQNPNLSNRARKYLLETAHPKKRVDAIIQILPHLTNVQKRRAITFLLAFKQDASNAPMQLQNYKNDKDVELRYAVEWLEKNLRKEGYL
ncbi:MAG: hypothetical protein PHI89_05035 [Thiovulaceae bacterium]|nr:hypothetical protein [Sulfurimonadaceae bacterium]